MKKAYIADFDSTLVYNSLLYSSLKITKDDPTKIPGMVASIAEVLSTLLMEDSYKKIDTIRGAYGRIFNNSKSDVKKEAISKIRFRPGAKKLIHTLLEKIDKGEVEEFHIATFAPEDLVVGKLEELAEESGRSLEEITNKIEIDSTAECNKVKNNLAGKYSEEGYEVIMIGDSELSDGKGWGEKPPNIKSYCVEKRGKIIERITKMVAGEMDADETKSLLGILKEIQK